MCHSTNPPNHLSIFHANHPLIFSTVHKVILNHDHTVISTSYTRTIMYIYLLAHYSCDSLASNSLLIMCGLVQRLGANTRRGSWHRSVLSGRQQQEVVHSRTHSRTFSLQISSEPSPTSVVCVCTCMCVCVCVCINRFLYRFPAIINCYPISTPPHSISATRERGGSTSTTSPKNSDRTLHTRSGTR